jgi:hypothetical protein
VLLIANLLPLLIFGTALATAEAPVRLSLISLLIAVLSMQLGVVRQSRMISACALASAFFLVLSPLLTLPALAIAATGLAMPGGGAARRSTHAGRSLLDLPRISPAMRIQLQILAASRTRTTLRLVTAIVVAIAADQLSILLAFDNRVLPMAIVALALIAITLGGFYRPLATAQQPMVQLMASLPLHRGYWGRRDIALVAALGLVPFTLVLGWLSFSGVLALPGALLLLAASSGLLGALRPTQVVGRALGTLLSITVAALWSGVAIAAAIR